MNRYHIDLFALCEHVPHRRGDEPQINKQMNSGFVMFPTGVGMNRQKNWELSGAHDVPHRRGDEPTNT